MNVNEALSSAGTNLMKQKMRSFLTMLGIIFGVGAVIAMLSIGAGAEHTALAAIDRLGVRNVIVRGAKIRQEDLAEVRKKSLGVSLRDAEAISEAVPAVQRVLPRVEVKVYKIAADGAKTEAKVFGVSSTLPQVSVTPLREGRFFDAREELEHAQVAIIGEAVRRDLFGFGPALGRDVKVNDVWVEVIGVLQSDTAAASTMGSEIPVASTARQILVPFTTATRKFERDPLEAPIDELTVTLNEGASPAEAAAVMRPLLARLHGGEDDYELIVPEALLEQSRKTQRMFNLIMGSIAGISLLVGGIGIMNIMLASVLERTREIGVRRAIGARRRDIQIQFIVESFVISFLGGIVGIVIGLFLAKIVAAIAGWPTVVSLWSILLSSGVSITVGWLSGIYPANRAASLNPIEALRYE
jgi:putative ABC transport system permease protein